VKCQHCDTEEVLPFKCPYCNGYFCPEHRLPENHGCPEIWRSRAPREAPPRVTVKSKAPYEYKITYGPQATIRKFRFSPTEIRHLTLSVLLVTGVGFSIFLDPLEGSISALNSPEILIGSSLVFVSVFLLHEIAHKLVAQHYGLWAEFRLTLFGALITLVSIFSPIFKIISPGAVMIAGYANKNTVGKTAVAGPATNLVLSIVSLMIYMFQSHLFIALLSAAFNAWIALFNLIPLGILDGWKVLSWNKFVWIVVFIPSIVLTIITFVRL
jgi:Zn-dependent protease